LSTRARDTVRSVERRRFFYVHVQKAAGTELRERLKRHFRPEQLYPDPTDGDIFTVAPQVSVRQLLARWAVRKSEIEIITGHFPYATTELLDADFVTLSVLREPVERTLSHLRHHRKMNPEARDTPLETIYEDVFRPAFFGNHMVKMFSLTAEEIATSVARDTWAMVMRIDFTPDRLPRAKAHVEQLDVLGLHDDFDDFCCELESRFGWQLGEPLYANRTATEEVPASLRARIATDNALDLELFEYARDLYEARKRGT
jgi:hypothetical protein